MLDISQLPVPQVFRHFADLCAIPHASGHTRAVSDHCAAFARERGLKFRQDEAGNVVIRKAGSPGREAEPAVLLQGHLDMVPAVADGVAFDFQRDSLRVGLDGDELHANGTTLGGDDGIAVAICLAILEDDPLSHPPLICVFTGTDFPNDWDAIFLSFSPLLTLPALALVTVAILFALLFPLTRQHLDKLRKYMDLQRQGRENVPLHNQLEAVVVRRRVV